MNLSKEINIVLAKTNQVAGTSEIDSSILDMEGYDGVMFIAVLGTVSNGGVNTFNVQQNTANQTSGMANITNAQAAHTDAGSGADSNTLMYVDVFRPQQRYVRGQWLRTVANTVVNAIIAIQYCASHKPTLADATVLASAFVAPTA